jgi:hypothetical protein
VPTGVGSEHRLLQQVLGIGLTAGHSNGPQVERSKKRNDVALELRVIHEIVGDAGAFAEYGATVTFQSSRGLVGVGGGQSQRPRCWRPILLRRRIPRSAPTALASSPTLEGRPTLVCAAWCSTAAHELTCRRPRISHVVIRRLSRRARFQADELKT